MTKILSPELNQNITDAKKRPVIITDRGRPADVLFTVEEDRRMTGGGPKIADFLAMPGVEAAELEIPERDWRPRPADLS